MQSSVNLHTQLFGRLIGALAILALGMSFGCSGDKPTDPDPTPPTPLGLLSVTPANGAQAVALGVPVVAVFSKTLDASTVTSTTFFIDGVSGTITVNDRTVTLKPTSAFAENTDYKLTITTGLKDTEGQALSAAFNSSFKTLTLPPDQLTLISVTPDNDADGVELGTPITAVFSKTLDAATVNSVTFFVTGIDPVEGAISVNDKTATFTPTSAFAENTTYTLTITTGLKDTEGQALSVNVNSSFKTLTTPPEPLLITGVSPGDGQTGVFLGRLVAVKFSKDIDSTTVTTSTFFISGVTGSSASSGVTATFTADNPFAQNTLYTLNITTGLKDIDGLSLSNDTTFSFTTLILPLASAGADQDASTGDVVTLNGSSNVAGALYTWTQTSGPTVSGALIGANPQFTAPEDVSTLTFELTVSDGVNTSGADDVVIYVLEDGANSYWVAPSGDDGNAGTRTAPMLTIQAAIDAANTGGAGADVYVAEGAYAESITLYTDVSVYGGYSVSWFRNIFFSTTRIEGGSSAMVGANVDNVTLDGLTITSADATTSSGSSIAVSFTSSSNLTITNNLIFAGSGANGSNGRSPIKDLPEPDGLRGSSLSCPRIGGDGGTGSGFDGGKGGTGRSTFSGSPGSPGAGPNGGAGGTAGGEFDKAPDGASGGPGTDVNHSAGGGSSFGLVSDGNYSPSNGDPGISGGNGGGGGGGGGAGAFNLWPVSGCGGAGGGGGAGGIGGLGGDGGMGGGASFGIILSNSSSAEISDNIISTSIGGNGAAGGAGAEGSSGGQGGLGISGDGTGGQGGDGGAGGPGGRGGNGASGGGGPSIGIVTASSSTASPTNNTFNLGTPGEGGPINGPSPGGQDGESAETKDVP